MSDMFEAGKFAALTKNLALSRTSELAGAILGKLSTTSNRLLLAPPPINLLLKSVIFLSGGGLICCLVGFF